MLKGLGMEVPKSIETRKYPCSKTGDDGMHEQIGGLANFCKSLVVVYFTYFEGL